MILLGSSDGIRTCPKTQYASGTVRQPGSDRFRNVGDKNHSTIMYSGCRLKPEIAQNNMNLLLVVMFSKLSGSLVICGLFKTQLYLFRFLILHSNQDFNIFSILVISYDSYQSAISSSLKHPQAVSSSRVSQFGDVRFLKFMLKIQQW